MVRRPSLLRRYVPTVVVACGLLGACGDRDEPKAPPGAGVEAPAQPPDPGREPGPAAAAEDGLVPSSAGTKVLVPEGIPVGLDGSVVPAEWEGAARLALGPAGPRLLVKQARGTLLFAFTSDCTWPRDGRLVLFLAPDEGTAGAATLGAARLDYEPREHQRPHLLVTHATAAGEQGGTGEAIARGRVEGPRPGVEIAVRSAWLGVVGPGASARRLAVLWVPGPGAPAVTWPEGLDLLALTRPPADYLDGTRWGRLEGLAAGRGAFSEAAWTKMTGEDADLWHRGEAAHGVALLIDEEPELRKKDREVVPDLVENLRWIAAREPLHPRDLLALATGYRFLNRGEEALAVLDALAMDPVWGSSESVRYQRARVLESRERWEEAAAAWRAARDVATPQGAGRYEAMAVRAEQRKADSEAERKAREEDLARSDLPLVLLRTNRGNVLIQCFAEDVPKSVEHFLDLVDRRDDSGRRTYDGTLFHRVLGDHLVQGGDPATAGGDCSEGGRGDGPRLVPVERNARHGFWRGAVGFARGVTNENGSQFFLLTSPRPELAEKGFTCFGHVVSGMDVVDRLEQCDVLVEARPLAPPR